MVSRKLVSFLLSELKTVRVICKSDGCRVVTELPMDQLVKRFGGETVSCPHCGGFLCQSPPGNFFNLQKIPINPLFMLAHAAEEAAKPTARFDIEFVLLDPT